jgi:hypothetical protein
MIVPTENWIDVVLQSGSLSYGSSELSAMLSEHLGKYIAEPSDQRHRINCVKICQTAIDRRRIYDRRFFEAIYQCCNAIDCKTLAGDAIKQYSGHCRDAEDYLTVLRCCRDINRGDLMD